MRRLSLTSLTILLATVACADGPSAPVSVGTVAGRYAARGGDAAFGSLSFRTTTTGIPTDWLAKGARIDIELLPSGGTSGQLRLPASAVSETEGDDAFLDLDLGGSWSLIGNHVRLSLDQDVFLRDLDFEVQGARLVAERTFHDTTVSVELARQ